MRARIEAFLDYLKHERRFSDNTISAYRNDLSQFAAFLADPQDAPDIASIVEIADLRDVHVRAFAEHLHRCSYASSTVARKMAALKSFANYLHRERITPDVLGRDIVVPRVRKARPRAISPADVERLVLAPIGSDPPRPEQRRDHAMLELLYASGLRVSELVALDVDDVDTDRAVLVLEGRRGERRELPLPERCHEALTQWVQHARQSIANREETAMFVNHRGNRLTRQGFWLILKSHAKRVGIDTITPHTIRHSFAAHAVEQGMDLAELQQRLGHVSSVTTQVYRRMSVQPRPREDEEDDGLNAVLREMSQQAPAEPSGASKR